MKRLPTRAEALAPTVYQIEKKSQPVYVVDPTTGEAIELDMTTAEFHPVVTWMIQPAQKLEGLGDAWKPPLDEAYAVYVGLFAPLRGSSMIVGPIADFVEVLRQNDKDTLYTDEEWMPFFMQFTESSDAARDMWDALLCQPSYL